MKLCDLTADINLQWILVGVILVLAVGYAVVTLLRIARHKGKKKSCSNCGACGMHDVAGATRQEQDEKAGAQDRSTKAG